MCDYKPSQPSLKTLKVHKDAVHLGIRYPCPHCDHPCTTKSNLNKHMIDKHERSKVFCKMCPYHAYCESAILTHTKKEHLGLGYDCNIAGCKYSTLQKASIQKHLRNC